MKLVWVFDLCNCYRIVYHERMECVNNRQYMDSIDNIHSYNEYMHKINLLKIIRVKAIEIRVILIVFL